jgi:competence protein ComEC
MMPLIAIQIGMVPITAFIFNYFSLSAFIINVPVIMLAGIILPIGIFLMLISLVNMLASHPPLMADGLYAVLTEIKSALDFLFSLLATAAEMLVFIMIALNRLTAQRGFWYFDIQNPSPVTLVIFYTMLFLCCSELGQWYFKKKQGLAFAPVQRRRRMLQALSLVILLVLGILFSGNAYHKADLIFLDVGQGDCLHVRTPSGKNILIDGGGSRGLADGGSGYDVGSRILLPYLLKSGVSTIDVAFISHLHDDHYKGIASLSQAMRIDKVVLYSGNQAHEQALISELNIGADSLIYVGKGDRITIEPGIYLDVLFPKDEISGIQEVSPDQAEPEDENAINLLMKLNYYGITIMMTGDLTGEDEAKIINEEKDLKADILKVPHHGSRHSSTADFIKAVNPDIAIIQVGKNNFGHPNPAVVENYLKQDIMLFRTDQDGAVLIDIGADRTLRMMTMLDQHWQTVRL